MLHTHLFIRSSRPPALFQSDLIIPLQASLPMSGYIGCRPEEIRPQFVAPNKRATANQISLLICCTILSHKAFAYTEKTSP